MALATWWQRDPLPSLTPLSGFHAHATMATSLLSRVTGLPTVTVKHRLDQGHQGYIAWIADHVVGYGWVATHAASIGELQIAFKVPPHERYLWDFATLPPWRGRGIYPHLLQTILQQAPPSVAHWWIVYAPENQASARGIRHAGFGAVGELSFHPASRVGLAPLSSTQRAFAGASVLQVPFLTAPLDTALAPCWQCVLAAPAAAERATCWQARLQQSSAAATDICSCVGTTD